MHCKVLLPSQETIIVFWQRKKTRLNVTKFKTFSRLVIIILVTKARCETNSFISCWKNLYSCEKSIKKITFVSLKREAQSYLAVRYCLVRPEPRRQTCDELRSYFPAGDLFVSLWTVMQNSFIRKKSMLLLWQNTSARNIFINSACI